ncbi:bifunctional N-acetylglucosamine-1-phosphate uridyltransferase/glucosamine-1-phosphate acetyltransferase [Arthrobacter sp. ZBG10]|uniref:bifunctional UDP-N-acetylglucosamine diphosphorylase/glucosamine-1-phosphate N-acetyltransferase GlmU n=1 Tax=Micrococcaceae TaxID=1268 RepID=UPI0006812E78|nr:MULTISPECIES: bifunctional UDP-N-acetylglucosamine diphosphorylase/glucosamine-1-phosphate N-acetyltransferase GlmU [Micrococcaceae]KNH16558.1 bifunctional N-acetylglucosamine-1-phosphate uridyltransferase/glucosamine-1-phosphate acetyltransferase [Arthrobacter sp. ZBG10]KQR02285.1 bifunctional N-acetylglucosamine-1-phosphate uridyltransferase/glucosamine-1-phosphate acetyltransferase [Arthrobacter sp. Leaf141]
MTSENAGPAAVIVLAAGAGTRMKSRTPKILHEIGGLSMVGHALNAARSISPRRLAVVVRHERDLVAGHLTGLDPEALIVDQDEVPGTGRAVEAAVQALDGQQRLAGTVVVTYGDVPLLTGSLLAELVATHERDGNAVTVLTAVLADAAGYGRILRAADGTVTGIREHKDASADELLIREVNSGIYAFDAAVLRDALGHVTTNNAQGEKYLTDVLGLAREAGGRVAAVATTDRWQVEGANDRVQLSALGAELNRRTVEAWMRAGVTVVDPATTWIDPSVTLDEDVRILPNTQLHGRTHVARDAVVGPDTTLTDVTIGEGATVTRTHGSGAVIGAGAAVGPFTYVRPGTVLGETGKIGAFYETKNVTIGRGSKLSHLGYAGDAEIGEDTNIGCGNITANYDGEKKHRTVIGSGVRTGSNTVFVAPVTVGDGAYSGAGAVIRKDVPAGALVLSVAAQRNAEGWVPANRPGTRSAELAQAATPDTSTTPASTEEGK